jgi:hypothetical protein
MMVTADSFLKDVANHEVRILRDDGTYRHVRVKQQSTYNMQFDIITYPWHLCYSGDMGTFVFSRLEDMFEFFRRDGIAPDYWAEKCVASDRHDGLRRYSDVLGRRAVLEGAREFARSYRLTGEDRAAFFGEVREEVWGANDDHRNLVDAAMNFRFQIGGKRCEVFPDFWDHQFEEYTGRFLWCCHALPWTIARYDAMKVDAPSV